MTVVAQWKNLEDEASSLRMICFALEPLGPPAIALQMGLED